MKRKGFTLIELLAVIVILAIIALISTPMILGIIEKSKKGAAQDSAYMYLDAVSQYMIVQEIKDTPSLLDGLYYVSEDTDYESSNIKSDILLNNIIKIKGKYPTDGYVEISNGKINDALLVFNDYEVTCNENIQCIVGDKVSFGLKKIILSTEIEDYTKLEENQIFKINISTIPENIEEEFTYTSSDNDIATVDENGNVKVIKKGNVKITVTASNGKTAELYVYMVEPEKPEISTDGGYPLITSHGISYSNKINIKYDEIRNDITNYYSVDNEQTWIKYDGPFTAYNSVISAKSVVNSTGKEVITSNVKINVATDALPAEAYDGTNDTKTGDLKSTKYIEVDSSMYNQNIQLSGSISTGYSFILNDGTEVKSKATGIITIPDNTIKIKFNPYVAGQLPNNVYDISVYTTPNIINEEKYPLITINGIEKPYSMISIDYHITAVQKLYRINNGEWKNYNNEKIRLEISDKIEAKSIDINKKESPISEVTIKVKDDALPPEAYDGTNDTKTGDLKSTKYIEVDSSMYNQNIQLSGSIVTGYSFILNDGTEVKSKATGIITIPDNTIKIKFNPYKAGQEPNNVYDISIIS